MPKPPLPNSQRLNPRDYRSFPRISALIPTVLGILIAVFGTAWTFTLAFKPQQVPKPTPSHKSALKSPIIEPTSLQPLTNILKPSHQPLAQGTPPKAIAPKGQREAIARRASPKGIAKHPVSDAKNTPLALYQFLSQPDILRQAQMGKRHVRRNQDSGTHQRTEFSSQIYENIWASLLTKAPAACLCASGHVTSSSAFQAVTSDQLSVTRFQMGIEPQLKPTTCRGGGLLLPPSLSSDQLVTAHCSLNTVNTRLTQNQPKPALKAREVRLTLSNIVILALENNRPIKNAYLERIAQRQELAVAEDKFSPDFTPSVSISIAQFGANSTTTDADLGLGATVSVKVPTGGELSFRWTTNSQTVSQNGLNLNINDDPFAQNLQLSFNQPLLRGYGVQVNRASIDIARLTEQVNILDLKSTLSNTLTEAIIAYRELIRAQERLKIAQLSLQRAQESLANNKVLIEAGRLAPVDIVQSETEVGRRQVSLIEAENNLEAARLALLNILDIDQATVIVAADPLTVPVVSLNSEQLRQLAFENQPDYLKAQLDLQRTQLALLQAENNRLWNLNLNTSYGYTSNNSSDLRVGLALSRQLGDLTVERDFQRSLVNKLKAENTLNEQRESLELQLTDRIREVNLSFSQVELAKKVTQLSERQLEIAQEKQRLGRDITVFELIRLQDDLVQARNIELNAIINYLNALTRLDQTLGTTLDTWQVTIERKSRLKDQL